ncbi:hypothetical protein KUTeg_009297 [Tegillarca granosa]|uniref:Translation factor GUF1 homolog, mitochondrial n=1 Tax=Tegillarca granosa TaxID=220873 RepID=A0ABQ9FAA5_TEGGR|nr:hypothetical protein KUTeg_009297 [Tegillarca granosa]
MNTPSHIQHIRNFCIIAHIDHGKSTLSDRIIEKTRTVEQRKMKEQFLDSMDIERERGITIKSASVRINYQAKNGTKYIFNLIDTPGHVDFNYEVSRSLAACEGALLVIDATQGMRAQTLANFFLAMENNLSILPVINKIDLPAADIPMVTKQIVNELGLEEESIVPISAKSGIGVDDLLEKIIDFIPIPSRKEPQEEKLQALIFDSFYDNFRGVVLCIRVFSGSISERERVKLFFSGKEYITEEVGHLKIERVKCHQLTEGEVGYVMLGIRSINEVRVGDTITSAQSPCAKPLPGYREVKPMVFSGVFPIDSNQYEDLQVAVDKLKLNDSSLYYEKDNSGALGFGYRCGFLGLLHMEVFQERIEREFNVPVLLTSPSVRYRVYLKKDPENYIVVDNPSKLPDPSNIIKIEEPYMSVNIITPNTYLGNVMQLVQDRRGVQKNLRYLDQVQVECTFEIPLGEVVFDFYDKLKSLSKGYASMDYDLADYRSNDIVKVEILVNKEPVDALSFMVHREHAVHRSRSILEKLKDEIPRHMFQIPLQAAIGSNIIARQTISAIRKDVTAKCYGGDISRKRKLLEKQKEGKKKMKSFGSVSIPQTAFINILKDR